MGFVRLDLGRDSSSADVSPLDLRVDILHSTEACGFGNVLIDGQPLSQTFDSETSISSGKGSISTSTNKIVVGSWSFDCIVIDGKPRGQLMKFMIDFVDGKTIENSGFSVLFRQTEETEIMNIETISSEEDQIIEHHSSSDRQHHNGKGSDEEHKHHMSEGPKGEHKHAMGNGPEGEHQHHMGHKEFNIHKELAELRYMKAQMKELKYLIHRKKHHISKHAREHHNLDDRIRDCDSLLCVAGVISEKARKFYGRIAGDEFDEESFHHSREPHSKKDKKHGKGFHGKPGNHTSGNHTSPHVPHGKNNHTGPHFPPHRHHVLPICHYPPPFDFHPHGPHHDGPHGPPRGPPHGPPHGPPPHEFGPHGFEHGRHHEMRPFHDDEEEHGPWEGRPRHHDGHHGDESEELERPYRGHDSFGDEFEEPHGKHTKPHHEQGPPSFDGPDFDHPEEHHHGEPPHEGPFDGPEHDGPHHPHGGPEHEAPHHPHNEEFHHSPPHNGPHEDQEPPFHPGPPSSHPPPPHPEPEHFNSPPHLLEDDFSRPPPHGPPHGPPHFPLHILKFGLIGFLLTLLLITLHRRTRTRTSKSHTTHPTHLQTRHRRRASFKNWWNRILGQEKDFEEKDSLLSDNSDSDSDCESENTPSEFSIRQDLSSFRNAVDVVGDMVAAEEGRVFSSAPAHYVSIPIHAQAHQRSESEDRIRHFDGYHTHGVGIGIGIAIDDADIDIDVDGEVLPAYEDNDGSEESGSVADGFRYTPGSSAYSPSHSASGSVSDVLGDKV